MPDKKAPVKKKPTKSPAKSKKSGSSFERIKAIVIKAALIFVGVSIFSTIVFRFVNPPITPLMVIRSIQMKMDGKEARMKHDWVDIEKISPNMVTAIMTSEDQNFANHYGFDFAAIRKAAKNNSKEDVNTIKGASTISQQTAKNVFLWPNRDWIRKGLECWFTLMIETFWSKERIMEVYLNVIEFGQGIYGIEAASQFYYNKPASKLTKRQAAALAAVVPAPTKWSPVDPSPKVTKHTGWILRHMGGIGRVKFD